MTNNFAVGDRVDVTISGSRRTGLVTGTTWRTIGLAVGALALAACAGGGGDGSITSRARGLDWRDLDIFCDTPFYAGDTDALGVLGLPRNYDLSAAEADEWFAVSDELCS